MAIKLDLDGAYIPAFNKNFNHLAYSYKKNFKIVGSAHNLKEIRIKEIQNVRKIFLSSLFKKNKNFLGFVIKKQHKISIPNTAFGEYFGLSSSMTDNKFSFPLSVQKSEVSKKDITIDSTTVKDFQFYDTATNQTIYESSLMIGSNNTKLNFNNVSSRLEFTDFHQASTHGQGEFFSFNKCIEPTTVLPTDDPDPSQIIQKIYQKENVFSQNDSSDDNLLFGLGVPLPKGVSIGGLQNPTNMEADLLSDNDLGTLATTTAQGLTITFPNNSVRIEVRQVRLDSTYGASGVPSILHSSLSGYAYCNNVVTLASSLSFTYLNYMQISVFPGLTASQYITGAIVLLDPD